MRWIVGLLVFLGLDVVGLVARVGRWVSVNLSVRCFTLLHGTVVAASFGCRQLVSILLLKDMIDMLVVMWSLCLVRFRQVLNVTWLPR